MGFNTVYTSLTARDRSELEVVNDFKYHLKRIVLKFDLDDNLKRKLFAVTAEPVMLYRAEAWTFTVQQEKSLDGAYTRMLQIALNVSWEDHIFNIELYGELACTSTKVEERKMALAGNCIRHPVVTYLIFWEPTQGQMSRDRQKLSYEDVLKKDTGVENREKLRTLIQSC